MNLRDLFPLPDWLDHAACTDHPPDLWFSTDERARTFALSICADCPARMPCLTACLDHEARDPRTPHGIYGGTTAEERRALRRKRSA